MQWEKGNKGSEEKPKQKMLTTRCTKITKVDEYWQTHALFVL